MARGDEVAPKPSVSNPVKGQVEKTQHNLRGGVVGYWEWNGTNWDKVEEEIYTNYKNEEARRDAQEVLKTVTVSAGPLEGKSPDSNTARWPTDQIQKSTDYVFFQFGKYIPPFGQEAAEGLNFRGNDKIDPPIPPNTKRHGYDSSIARMKVDDGFPTIMLPIPQDLSNTLAAGWQGKAFTGMGRAAIAAVAGGNNAFALQKAGDFSGNIKAIQDSLTTNVLNLVPGVGGALDVNDISGSARGVILNPNAELLYDSPELREIGMSFKMVPKNAEEAYTIRKICQTFRKAALPVWGAEGDITMNNKVRYATKGDAQGATGEGGKTKISGENFIRVPHLCKFTFMKGSKPHGWITQFKPCAISNIVVNYTPDNTYATYNDGSPVATEIRLNFQETKLIFRDDVDSGF